MENAIKALLISAGVLVAILVISLGMMIFGKNTATDDASSALSELEITEFNRKYKQYEGIRAGSTVVKVLNYVIQDNDFLNEQRDSTIGINLRSNIQEMIDAFPSWGNALTTREYGVMYSSNIALFRDKIKRSAKYKIWFSYDKNGLIHEIHIDEPYK